MNRSQLIRSILFSALLAAVLFTLNLIAVTYAPQNEVTLKEFSRVVGDPPSIEALAIGSSINVAIDFKPLGLAGAHMTRSGSDLHGGLYLSKVLSQQLPELKYIFIPVDYLTLMYDNSTSFTKSSTRRFTYQLANFNIDHGLINDDWRNYLLSRFFPLIRADNWWFVIRMIRKPPSHNKEPARVVVYDPEKESIIQYTAKISSHFLTSIKQTLADNSTEVRDNIERMIVLSQELKNKGIEVVFYTPPVIRGYTTVFKEKMKSVYHLFNQQLKPMKQSGQLIYYDFSEEDTIIDNYNNFSDPTHLNTDGARLFSHLLLQRLCGDKRIKDTFGSLNCR